MKGTIVYQLLEIASTPEEYFDKGDIVSAETLDIIMETYYEIKVKLIRIL